MTLFGIDISNYQGPAFDVAAARREGFVFLAAKVSEGDGYRDPYWPRNRDLARAHGFHLTGYHYVRPGDPDRQADAFTDHLGDRSIPAMLDFEDGSGGIDQFWAVRHAIEARGVTVRFSYIPRWYWQRIGSPPLDGVPGLWASAYVNGSGYASVLYPGDDAPGWAPYGGVTPVILQFSDRGLVAGQRIDVDAFRGSETELAALFGSGMEEDDMAGEAQDVQRQLRGPDLTGWPQLGGLTVVDALAEVRDQLGGPDHHWGGWPQLGNRTLVDAVAVIGEHLGLPGFTAPTR